MKTVKKYSIEKSLVLNFLTEARIKYNVHQHYYCGPDILVVFCADANIRQLQCVEKKMISFGFCLEPRKNVSCEVLFTINVQEKISDKILIRWDGGNISIEKNEREIVDIDFPKWDSHLYLPIIETLLKGLSIKYEKYFDY